MRVPKRSLAPCKPCFAPGKTPQNTVLHRARDCFGTLTPEARKHLSHSPLSTFGILAVLTLVPGQRGRNPNPSFRLFFLYFGRRPEIGSLAGQRNPTPSASHDDIVMLGSQIRMHAKGVVLCEKACFCLLSAFYNTPLLRTLLRTSVPTETLTRRLLRTLLRRHFLLSAF